MRDKWGDVHNVDVNRRLFKTSDELKIEVRNDILELQAQGYLKDIVVPALPAPKKKTNDR